MVAKTTSLTCYRDSRWKETTSLTVHPVHSVAEEEHSWLLTV